MQHISTSSRMLSCMAARDTLSCMPQNSSNILAEWWHLGSSDSSNGSSLGRCLHGVDRPLAGFLHAVASTGEEQPWQWQQSEATDATRLDWLCTTEHQHSAAGVASVHQQLLHFENQQPMEAVKQALIVQGLLCHQAIVCNTPTHPRHVRALPSPLSCTAPSCPVLSYPIPPRLCCSQQISFGLHNPQDIIHCGVFNVYERALFKVRGTDRQTHVLGFRADV